MMIQAKTYLSQELSDKIDRCRGERSVSRFIADVLTGYFYERERTAIGGVTVVPVPPDPAESFSVYGPDGPPDLREDEGGDTSE